MPHTLAALTRGEISEWRATLVVRETATLSHADRAQVDRELDGHLVDLPVEVETPTGQMHLSRAPDPPGARPYPQRLDLYFTSAA